MDNNPLHAARESELEAELRKVRRFSDALNDINSAIHSGLGFDSIMQKVVVDVARTIGAESAIIYLPEEGGWAAKYSYGLPREMLGRRLTEEEIGYSMLAVREHRTVICNDALHDELVDRQLVERYGINAILDVALMMGDNLIGDFSLHYHAPDRKFTEVESDFVNKAASSITLALKNALLAEERSRAEEALRLNEQRMLQALDRLMILVGISSRVLDETTIEGTLNRAVEGALTLTEAKIATSGHGFKEGRITIGAVAHDADMPPCPKDTSFTINRGGVYLDLFGISPTIRLTEQELVEHPAWWGLPEGHAPLKGLLGARLQGQDGSPNGMILVSHKRHGEFTEEDEALLTQLCLLTSLAIKHIEAREAEEERADELDAVRNRLETILQTTPTAVYLMDEGGRFLHVNRRFEEVFGLGLQEIQGRTIFDLLPQSIAAPIDANNRQVLDRCAPAEFEELLPQADGLHVFSSVKSPLYSSSGRCYAVVGISTDITGRKVVEQALRESEERFREVFAHAPVGMVILSPDGRFLHVNGAYCSIMGYPEEELLRTDFNFQRITHPDDLERNIREVNRMLAGETDSFFIEKRNVRRNGSVIWVRLSESVRRNAEGRPLQIIGLVENINERKEAEEALKVSERNYRTIFDSASDAFFIHSAATGEILDVNQKVTEMYKFSPEEIRHLNVGAMSADTEGFTQEEALRFMACAAAGEPQMFEWLGRDRYGTVFWVEVSLKSVILGGENRLLAIVRDISERKQTEESLRRAMEELARSNSELEQFAYAASHDLQEPLRMVASYLQLLELKYRGRLDEKADTYIHFAVDGAKRMQKLIEGLLSYSRLSRGASFHPVDTNAAFSGANANLAAAIGESGAEVTSEELPTVTGDEIQMVQLFQNLIGNALKYRRPDVPPRVHVSATKQGDEWVFAVKDNGIGIDPKDFGRIFLIFQRLHTREEYEGTGIGLASCKKIVERHRGRIWVESAVGAGSTFYFTIPVEAA